MSGLAVKTLSAVEVNSLVSHQHEFNGVAQLKQVFGMKRLHIPASFFYMSNNGVESKITGSLTWYDAREGHPQRTEYRLYYDSALPLQKAKVGDTLLITFDASKGANVFIIARDTQLVDFLASQIGSIGKDYCIVTDSHDISVIENFLLPRIK